MTGTEKSETNADAADRLDGVVIWNAGEPPEGVMLLLKCDDYMGGYTMKAKRVDYKKPPPGASKKAIRNGFRKGWRWIKENGETIDRKETPSAWAYI